MANNENVNGDQRSNNEEVRQSLEEDDRIMIDDSENEEQNSSKCLACLKRSFHLIKAILMRIMLGITILLITWRAASVSGAALPTTWEEFSDQIATGRKGIDDNNSTGTPEASTLHEPWFVYWMPCLGIILLVPEFFVIWGINDGHEYKWWSPALAIYVFSSLISIWVIELDLYTLKWYGLFKYPNATNFDSMDDVFPPESFDLTNSADLLSGVHLRAYEWGRLLQQLFFISIFISRWLGPKGALTRQKLSQLLLVYLSIATDIMDMTESLMFVRIGNDFTHVVLIMTLYSMAHIQFTLNYTATLARPVKFVSDENEMEFKSVNRKCSGTCFCLYTDMWSLLVTVCLQDGPFLVLRLYIIFGLNVITFGNVFFTVKNAIAVTLDIYRIITILIDECQNRIKSGKADTEEVTYRSAEDSKQIEFKMVVSPDNSLTAVAEYEIPEVNIYDDEHENESKWKRKTWKHFQLRPTYVETDSEVHLIYEIELILDEDQIHEGDNTSCAGDFETSVFLRDVRFRSIVMENVKPNVNFIQAPEYHGLRQRISRSVQKTEQENDSTPVDVPPPQLGSAKKISKKVRVKSYTKLQQSPKRREKSVEQHDIRVETPKPSREEFKVTGGQVEDSTSLDEQPWALDLVKVD